MKSPAVWLKLNGKIYTTPQLAAGIDTEGLSLFEQTTLSFCQEWLSGKESFTLKTSGSTGEAKEIKLSRKQMEASAQLTAQALNLQQGYTALLALDTNYIAGKMMVVRSLVTGMNMIAVSPTADPLANLDIEKIDFAALVPYQVKSILASAESEEKLNGIKTVLIGGAALDLQTQDKLQQFNCSVYATYGMTETLSHIALQKINGEGKQDYFETLRGIDIGNDERGCLTIDAKALGLEKITTNDFVKLHSSHHFTWLGRWDNVINTGGIKVSPEKIEREIEKLFFELHLQNRYLIVGIPDELLGTKVVLLIEGSFDHQKYSTKILSTLSASLSKYEAPKEIKIIQKFIETRTQKINRTATLQLIA